MQRAMNRRRGPLIALLLFLSFVAACVWLPLAAALALGAVVILASIALFKSPRWRNSALVLASVLIGLAGFQLAFGLIDPGGLNDGVTRVTTPEHWQAHDPVLGYRSQPETVVHVKASYRDQLIYDATYTIDSTGARVTPGSGPDGPTWLFIGDSTIFSEGLDDPQALPSQFAQLLKPAAHVVNLGVPGYGPNHLVRALETGAYDGHVVGKVAAVVTWINSQQMRRVTGDGGWLTLSPRYEFRPDGPPLHTGTFLDHRLSHPLDGISYYARSRVPWVERIVGPELAREQQKLYVALIARLQELVRQKWKAPLVIIYDWDDGTLYDQLDAPLRPVYEAIRALGPPMVSMRALIGNLNEDWDRFLFKHDGHPNALLDAALAKSLLKRVQDLQPQ
jgi:hypothetical protein